MSIPNAVSLATIIGRIIALFRKELGQSQTELAGRMKWDRSVLSRIEGGRNTATIDNIFELEELFMADHLIKGHGDLTRLTSDVVYEARRRGLRPVVGHDETPEGEEPVEAPALDRIVARVIDDWLVGMNEPEPEPPAAPAPAKKKARTTRSTP
jgi:transcriptional regulator with XRE-family HTH domain